MKQQTLINLTLAMGGTLLLAVLVGIHAITLRDWIFVCVGVWAMATGHFVAGRIMDRKQQGDIPDSFKESMKQAAAGKLEDL